VHADVGVRTGVVVTLPRLSVQLYSVREALDADLDATFARLSAQGFALVEPYDFVRRAPELAAALSRHGLAAPTAHAPLVTAPAHDEVFDAAAELGARVVIDPMVVPERWASIDEVRRTAEALNVAAEAARPRGLVVGYHNHSQEFHHSFDGVSAYELFVSELDEAVVLELDAYWAAVGGQDVPALVERLGRRVIALHVKDGRIDTDPFRTGDFDPATLGQVPAGRGAVPLSGILDAAVFLEYAIVEYDSYAGDIFDGVAGTAAFLAERGVR
jgi:sugar phosphate isomerase/epimerase